MIICLLMGTSSLYCQTPFAGRSALSLKIFCNISQRFCGSRYKGNMFAPLSVSKTESRMNLTSSVKSLVFIFRQINDLKFRAGIEEIFEKPLSAASEYRSAVFRAIVLNSSFWSSLICRYRSTNPLISSSAYKIDWITVPNGTVSKMVCSASYVD